MLGRSSKTLPLALLPALLPLALGAGCLEVKRQQGDTSCANGAQLRVQFADQTISEGEVLLIESEGYQPGEAVTLEFVADNVGCADLTLSGVEMAADPAESADLIPDALPITLAPRSQGGVAFGFNLVLFDEPSTVGLVIDSDDLDLSFSVDWEGLRDNSGGDAVLVLEPSQVDFDTVLPGSSPPSQQARLSNEGDGPLLIEGVAVVEADPAFSVEILGKTQQLGTVGEVLLEEPYELAPGAKLTLIFDFAPGDPKSEHAARLEIFSNDAEREVAELGVSGAVAEECLEITTADEEGLVSFGLVEVGVTATEKLMVNNCGGDPIILTEVGFDGDQGPFNGVAPEGFEPPFELGPDLDPIELELGYSPIEPGECINGSIKSDQAVLTFTLASGHTQNITLIGGASGPCVPPEITIGGIAEGFGAQVGAELSLFASHEACTTQASVFWELVSKPAGSLANIKGSTTAEATLTPDLAGSYQIVLEMQGAGICPEPVVRELQVDDQTFPPQQVEVKLEWTDETADGPPIDLDLHFVDFINGIETGTPLLDFFGPQGPDGWFSSQWDCHGAHPPGIGDLATTELDWGVPGEDSDNPKITKVPPSNGGAGEVLNVAALPPGQYLVGVHYWAGPEVSTQATLSVTVSGEPVVAQQLTLGPGDFWFVGLLVPELTAFNSPDTPQVAEGVGNIYPLDP